MQSQKQTFIFIVVLVLAGLLWAGIYFLTDRQVQDDGLYGVVQTVSTKPSPQALVDAYYNSLMVAAQDIANAEDCDAATAKADAYLSSARVPKEFLDNHLEAFLLVKKQIATQEETCLADIGSAVRGIADTVTSTVL